MPDPIAFDQIGRLPAEGDNAAIAVRRLEAGAVIAYEGVEWALDTTVLEGHRFAVRPIEPGDNLLSWGLPFGVATRPIVPGGYLCNQLMLEALRGRNIDFEAPAEPNFQDISAPYVLDEGRFVPGEQVPPAMTPRHFLGYPRPGGRGVGTRNFIVILGTTSQAGNYARQLAERLKGEAAAFEHITGIVPVAHTEGGEPGRPNNLELVLRTLAGFVVHPNVGAVLAVDYGGESVSNARLQQFMQAGGYPVESVPHRFVTLKGSFQADLDEGVGIVRGWLGAVNAARREPAPLAHLAVALQCGGSDAFSGISGNPLAAAVAKEVIRDGGQANLAETDELMGAEAYVLENVRDLETARAFLARLRQFRQRLAWHGVTPEGNPSGGNRYRGLYNIALKSIGAARKLDPQVRLDHVIDYGERMRAPGFYYMDSPGNDLESIAGQVASGANIIFFITGNGSITNFPFVPTIKVMTTSARYRLLEREMDVNAGAYLDGAALDDLAQEMLDLTLAVASGVPSKGEAAGHSQVQIWRNWRQTDTTQVERLSALPEPAGRPIPIQTAGAIGGEFQFEAAPSGQVNLIVPTSLCAGQIARMAAERMNRGGSPATGPAGRFVALAHTEGCGFGGQSSYRLYPRLLVNYMAHPLVRHGLFLEHGCEKTHNDYMRRRLEQTGREASQYGWASIQLDGGIERVLDKVEAWFGAAESSPAELVGEAAGLASLSLGLMTHGLPAEPVALHIARVVKTIVAGGGTVVAPDVAGVLQSNSFREALGLPAEVQPSLAFGQAVTEAGFHIMESPSAHWVETLTGLGATGVQVILALPGDRPLQGHPMVPVVQVAGPELGLKNDEDFDLRLAGEASGWGEQVLKVVLDAASGRLTSRSLRTGNVDFQISRGLLGVST